MKKWIAASMLALVATTASPVRAVDLDAYVKRDSFTDIKISPNGDYYAATVLLEDRTALVVLNRETLEVTGNFTLERNTHVIGFQWVSPERLVISTAQKFGLLAQPLPDGNLYAINADGSRAEILAGQSVASPGPGTTIKPKKVEPVQAYLVDDLPAEDKFVVVSITPFNQDPFTRADRMDVFTGRRIQLAAAPVRNARMTTDNAGEVRFAIGADVDNALKLYYRAKAGADWELIRDEDVNPLIERPVGFSADDNVAYFIAERSQGPDAIVAYDVGKWDAPREVARDASVDPDHLIYRNNTHQPVGVMFMGGTPRTAFFDPESSEARLYKSLEAAFPGQAVSVTSTTDDNRLVLVAVWSDTSPGDYFLFDTVAKKANHVVSRAQWIDPDAMARMRSVTIPARDGLPLQAYLTVPAGSDGKSLPTIVLPHGGPYGIRDYWTFQPEVQMLADAGYAVLQVNFRGSGGFGKAFKQAGARQWGKAMQDDLTDATRWAIEQGHADPARICLYGASYGAYASLMGVAKEPSLYRCAAGYVGVYDLPAMQKQDARDSSSLGNWSKDWVGDVDTLGDVSPNRFAERIKVPVFLAAGGEDEVAPVTHTEMMERALKQAGVPVESLYYRDEGHGFYKEEHRREFYTRLLAFFARSLGGEVATTGSTQQGAAGN
ncbi:alpha/beta hydrolase family protein [Marilutibacter spongiae]|uniref:S9 family peptidase n=1 Tax=Marilutibacter spongiae TaxID=2025720 RepID=A0A7W3TL17_9GAMM|nr:S9 family peptidase [Lysobacter spongiae]MBB1060307.1 S9 family peptidase [Lysobacter spongiae]